MSPRAPRQCCVVLEGGSLLSDVVLQTVEHKNEGIISTLSYQNVRKHACESVRKS